MAYLDADVEDVWIKAAEENGLLSSPRAMRGSEFVDFETLTASPFYKKCLQPNDIVDTLAIPVSVSEGIHGTFLVHANSSHGFFTDDDVHLAEKLSPFIKAGIKAYAAIARAENKAKLASEGLRSSNLSLYIFDRDLKPMFVSDAPMSVGSNIISTNERLSSAIPDVMAWIRKYVTELPAGDDTTDFARTVVTNDETGDDFVLQISHYDADADRALNKTLNVNCFALLIRPASYIRNLDIKPAGKVFGFTETELDIVSSLLAGETVQEIATSRDTLTSTVRWHVKNAMSKSGCKRQIDMIMKIQSISFQRKVI